MSAPTPTPDAEHDKYKTIAEGSATMVYPADEESSVFYNPVQVQNRDLSVLMIALYAERRRTRMAIKAKKKELRNQEVSELKAQLLQAYEQNLDIQTLINEDDKKDGIHVLDALAASGLRSIRYWKEIAGIAHITINDLDAAAVERAHANVKKNSLLTDVVDSRSSTGIRIQHADATHEMYNSRRNERILNPTDIQLIESNQYDVIDLDPYGSAAPFLDAAVQAVTDGGLLNITCTDMAALGGSHPETCYGRYASMPIQRSKYLHEMALRILLQSVATAAAKYGRTIRPILSVGMDFYIRCFVEIHDSKAAVNELSLHIGSVYQSTQCGSFHIVPHGQFGKNGKKVYQPGRPPSSACEETGAPFKVGGPIWCGVLHDESVVAEALLRLQPNDKSKTSTPNLDLIATKERLIGLLTSVSEELHDIPLHHTMTDLCHTLGCNSPPLNQMRAAIVNAGYRVGGFHKNPLAIKTDAPNSVVWDIMRVWCKKNPPQGGKKKKKKHKLNETKPDDEAPEQPKQFSAGQKILAVEPTIEVDFTVTENSKLRRDVARFPMNPQRNWGPKPRASGKRKHEETAEPPVES